MANSAVDLSTLPFATSDVRGDTDPQQHLISPGPLRRSDLNPLTPSPISCPHRLEPLQLVEETVGKRKGTKKKKKKRRREEGEGEEQGRKKVVGNNSGPVPSRDLLSGDARKEVEERSAPKLESPLDSPPDPLLGKSTFQQLQAQLDPLYTVPPSQNTDPSALQGDADPEIAGNADKEAEEEIKREEEEASEDLIHNLGHGDMKDEDKQIKESRKREKTGNTKRKRTHRENREQEVETAIERSETDTNEHMHPPEPLEIASEITSEIPSENKEDREDFIISPLQMGSERPAPEYYPPPEDIQEQDGEDESTEDYIYRLPTSSSTQQRDVIFIERRDRSGFIVQQRGKGGGSGDGGMESGGGWGDREISSAEFALLSHRFIQNIALIAHGLLAGLSLWDGVVSNVLSHQTDLHLTLVQHYHSLVLLAHSLYLTLLSLVCLSLLDRVNLTRLNKNCWKFTFHSLSGIIILLATLLTSIALLVSVSLAATDERISLYPDQPALWPDLVTTLNLTTLFSFSTVPPTTHPSTNNTNNSVIYVAADHPVTSRLTLWLIMSLLRSTCCVLGWGLMVWVSHHDRLKEHLMEIAGTSANIPLLTSNKLQPINNDPQPTNNGSQLTHNGLQHQTSTTLQGPLTATNRPFPPTNGLLYATNRPLHSTGQHFPTTSIHTPLQPPVDHYHQLPVDQQPPVPIGHWQPPKDHYQPQWTTTIH